MDLLSAMRSFRRIVELGSFSRASEDLSLSPAGLSKQIRLLEEHLGTVLLHRTTRRMSLTDPGSLYFAECCRILDQLEDLERNISESATAISGRLRVNVPISFGLLVVSPLLPDFIAAHPELKIDLVLSDQLLDVVGAGFDISIRIRPELQDSSLVARRLADAEQIICASPAYLARRGTPTLTEELHQHDCLIYSLSDNPATWRLTGPGGGTAVTVEPRISANNSLILRDLLVAGAGIGSLPSFVANPSLRSGALVRILRDHRLPTRHVYAVYPTSRHLLRKVRVFVDYLAEAFAREPCGSFAPGE